MVQFEFLRLLALFLLTNIGLDEAEIDENARDRVANQVE